MKTAKDFPSVDDLAKRAFAVGVASSKRAPVLDVGGPLDGWRLTMMDCIRFHGALKAIVKMDHDSC